MFGYCRFCTVDSTCLRQIDRQLSIDKVLKRSQRRTRLIKNLVQEVQEEALIFSLVFSTSVVF